MRWSLNRTDTLVFGAAIVVVAFVGVLSYVTTGRLIATAGGVAATRHTLKKLEEVRSDLARAEAAQRGYVLTGQESRLEPYRVQVSEIHRDLEDLRQLATEKGAAPEAISVLASRVDATLKDLDVAIALGKDGRLDAARAAVANGPGETFSAAFREIADQIEQQQGAELERDNRAEESSAKITGAVVVSASLLALTLLALVILRLDRDVGRRNEAEAALVRAQSELEDRVRDRTAELSRLQRQGQLILDSAGEGICGIDVAGRMTFVNPAALRMLGWEAPDLLGLVVHDLVHHSRPDGTPYPVAECLIQSALRDDTTYRADDEVFWRKDGGSFPVAYVSTPMRGENGELLGAVVTFDDITERKRAQEEVKGRERDLAEAQQLARLGRWEWDMAADRVRGSLELFLILGLPPANDLSGDELRGQILRPDRERLRRSIGDAFEADRPLSMECMVLRPDGSRRTVLVKGQVQRDATHAAKNMVGTIMDISELRQAEERIREQAALLDQARDAIMVRDLSGCIQFWNKGAEALFGWTAEEAVGQDGSQLLVKHDLERLQQARSAVLEAGAWAGELSMVTKAGTAIAIEGRWTLLRDLDGQPKSLLIIDTDVTEKKKIETQILRAQRMESIGTLAGGIAHDLNNVLAPVVMAAEILTRNAADDRTRKLLATIEASARRGADMVRQILTFARGIEGERVILQPRHLVRDVEKIARDTFPKSIEVRIDAATDLAAVSGDATQLHQVLLNLCVNARDAMEHGGVLRLSAQNVELDEHSARLHVDARAGSYVLMTVTDTGTGMPPGVIERVFEPFYTTKEVGKGTGLGLSTSLAIVKSHGGFMSVYSEVGRGTTFKVYLPATTSPAASAGAPRAVDLPVGNGELILVVDDEILIREMAKETLESYGYKVKTASDGTEAVALCALAENRVAAMVTDMRMPFMDGPATIRALRRMVPDLKIIATSGLREDGIEAAAGAGPLQAFLQKPYSTEDLLGALRRALAG